MPDARDNINVAEMSPSLRAELDKLAAAHRILEMEGHGDMTLGHMSLRDPEGRGVWLKRLAIGLGEVMSHTDFILIDFDGKKLSGEGRLHNEWPIHTEIMLARPDINVVSHTHPFYSCVFSATEEQLKPVALEGGYFHPGVPHDKSTAELINTRSLGNDLAKTLGGAFAVFMKNHGVTFCGGTVEHATLMGIFLEKACKAQLLIQSSGIRWSWPTDEDMARRTPQTFITPFLERSWDFYVRKLKYVETAHPLHSQGHFKL